MSIFTHTQVKLPENAIFKISPSKISEFFSHATCWYRSEILGEDTFTGSTSSVLGSTCHYLAEQYALAKLSGEPLDTDVMISKIESDLADVKDSVINKEEVLLLYKDMASALINDYLSSNLPSEVEAELISEIKEGVYVGGSCDAILHTGDTCTIIDYKFVGKKPNTESLPWTYYVQTLAYAYCQKKKREYIESLTEEECKKLYLSKHSI